MIWWLLLLPCTLALRDLEPPPPQGGARSDHVPEERWLNVRLNHFDASNTETFPMRYYFNNEFGGPHIVIFVGGEWEIHPGWTTRGLAVDVAAEVGAAVFYTEHRYYGLSRPSVDTSVDSLRYLTVDQALGDLAQFIQYVKSDEFEHGYYKNGKVVLVGCSYAGSMATWMKLAYPHLIDGAFSDSGPLQAQEDFPEYVEVITEAISQQGGAHPLCGAECLSRVTTAISRLVELLETAAGPATVSQMFNTCTTLSATTPLDVATFFWFGIQETFAYLVQYANPGDIPEACAVLMDGTDPVQSLASWITSQPWTQPCIETRYTEVVAAHTNTSYDHPQSVMRLWTYQTCVEYGWFQTTTGNDHFFQNTVPLEYYHQMCKDFFGVNFDETFLRSGIERTNLFFAGWTHLPDNVVSVVGGHDPWSPVGPNATHATLHAPVYVVQGVSHCNAIQPLVLNETTELEEVKLAVANHLGIYLTGSRIIEGNGATQIVASILLMIFATFAVII